MIGTYLSEAHLVCVRFANNRGIKFSLYVDDMTFSSSHPIPKAFHYSVGYLLNKVGLTLKEEKTRYLSAHGHKIITGVDITPNGEIRVSNRNRQKILQKLKSCGDLFTTNLINLRSLYGSLLSARQIEHDFFEPTFNRVKSAILLRKMIQSSKVS